MIYLYKYLVICYHCEDITMYHYSIIIDVAIIMIIYNKIFYNYIIYTVL